MIYTKYRIDFLLIMLIIASCQRTDEISYSDEIKPLLNKKCLRCHGGIRALGGFNLLFEEDAFAETESGKPAIVPYRPAASEMMKRIQHSDPELKMPQEGSPLTSTEIELLETWIRQGAKFDQHWSYRPLKIPNPPRMESDWPSNDLDQYILKQMTDHELSPSEKADPATLIRRLSFDITGLPPNHIQAKNVLKTLLLTS